MEKTADEINESDVGTRFQLLVRPSAHPYCKFVPDAVENGYVCTFTGVLQTIFDDKWEQGLLLRFSDVDFEKRKKHQQKKHWDIFRTDIIEFTLIT